MKWISLSYIIVLTSTLRCVVVDGMSSGAPVAACETGTNIVPNHSPNTPSTNQLPFSVDLTEFTENIYNPGRTYTITMRGGPNDSNFRGFMIQGRLVADDSPTGTFADFGTNFQSQCNNNTAATHTNGNQKTSVVLSWTAPPVGTGNITFRFAFTDSFPLFWANIHTATIQEGPEISITLSSTVMTATTTSTPTVTPSPTGSNTGRGSGVGLLASTMMILFLAMFPITIS
ncbi:putative defense protein [Dysidea avara]|uniref:putative defense protein n=1 Tax=Dysidea avara TaxID=196820 RepID=UPI00332A9B70